MPRFMPRFATEEVECFVTRVCVFLTFFLFPTALFLVRTFQEAGNHIYMYLCFAYIIGIVGTCLWVTLILRRLVESPYGCWRNKVALILPLMYLCHPLTMILIGTVIDITFVKELCCFPAMISVICLTTNRKLCNCSQRYRFRSISNTTTGADARRNNSVADEQSEIGIWFLSRLFFIVTPFLLVNLQIILYGAAVDAPKKWDVFERIAGLGLGLSTLILAKFGAMVVSIGNSLTVLNIRQNWRNGFRNRRRCFQTLFTLSKVALYVALLTADWLCLSILLVENKEPPKPDGDFWKPRLCLVLLSFAVGANLLVLTITTFGSKIVKNLATLFMVTQQERGVLVQAWVQQDDEPAAVDPQTQFLSPPEPFSRTLHSKNLSKPKDGKGANGGVVYPSGPKGDKEMKDVTESTKDNKDSVMSDKDSVRTDKDSVMTDKDSVVINFPKIKASHVSETSTDSSTRNHRTSSVSPITPSTSSTSRIIPQGMFNRDIEPRPQSSGMAGGDSKTVPLLSGSGSDSASSGPSTLRNEFVQAQRQKEEKFASPRVTSTEPSPGNRITNPGAIRDRRKRRSRENSQSNAEESPSDSNTTEKTTGDAQGVSNAHHPGSNDLNGIINDQANISKTNSGNSLATSSLEDGPACTICLTEFEEGELIRTLPECDHIFHAQCLEKWARQQGSSCVCPMCRRKAFRNEGKPSDCLAFIETQEYPRDPDDVGANALLRRSQPLATSLGVDIHIAALTVRILDNDLQSSAHVLLEHKHVLERLQQSRSNAILERLIRTEEILAGWADAIIAIDNCLDQSVKKGLILQLQGLELESTIFRTSWDLLTDPQKTRIYSLMIGDTIDRLNAEA